MGEKRIRELHLRPDADEQAANQYSCMPEQGRFAGRARYYLAVGSDKIEPGCPRRVNYSKATGVAGFAEGRVDEEVHREIEKLW